MRPYLATAAIVAFAWSATAQEGPVETVIDGQLDAFQADDFETAFSFASPMIQEMFGTSEAFGAMVRQGYPMVHRPGDVQFLDIETIGDLRRQKVLIRDRDGAYHLLEYEMIKGPQGWLINGVSVLQEPQVGA